MCDKVKDSKGLYLEDKIEQLEKAVLKQEVFNATLLLKLDEFAIIKLPIELKIKCEKLKKEFKP